MTSKTWRVRVLKADRPTNPDPIKVQAGDLLEIAGKEDDGWIWCRDRTGKEDWVPLSYMTAEDEGNTRTMLSDYDSTVLSVEVGEEFQAEREENGWLWCTNTQGKWGWIRVKNVERIGQA
jgi:Variant SH3 domain